MTHLTDYNWIKKPYLDSKENHHSKTPSLFKQGAIKYPKIRNSFFLILILLACSQVGFGQAVGDYGSVATGNWSSTSTWKKWVTGSPGSFTGVSGVPGLNDIVWIGGGFTVTVGTGNSYSCKSMTILSGSSLALVNKTLIVYGYFTNGGTFTSSSGSILSVSGALTNNGSFTSGSSGSISVGSDFTNTGTTFKSVGAALTVFGNFKNSSTFNANNGELIMAASGSKNIDASGTNFYNLTINSSAIITGTNNFAVDNQMAVEGIFAPESNVVISSPNQTAMLGSGTVRVTNSTSLSSGGYKAQYSGFGTNSVLNVDYSGSAEQVISPNGITRSKNLFINNSKGCKLKESAEFTNITLTSGALTIAPNAALKVNGTTYLNNTPTSSTILNTYSTSCLILQSDEIATGSFIHIGSFSGPGTVTVERYMHNNDFWHIYSSPIQYLPNSTPLTVHNFLKYNPEIPDLNNTTSSEPVYLGVGMREYDTSTDSWADYFKYNVNDNVTMQGGKGYSIRTFNEDKKGTGIVYASGIPNPNTITVSLSGSSNGGSNKGWNCVGNPFTCSVNGNAFLNTIESVNPSYQAVYIWDPDPSVSNYTTDYSIVQVGQGFFVNTGSDQNVNFTIAMQTPDNESPFKGATIAWPFIKVVATSNTFKSSTKIKFVTNTSRGLDPGYDLGMLKGNKDFALYSKLLEDNGVDFTVQSLPDQNYDQYVIPIGIDCKAAGEITFTAETVNLPVGCQALLEDRLTKKFTRLDLKDAKYTATVSVNTKGTGRFFLHTSDVISGDRPIGKEQFNISKIGKTLYINGEVSDNANFFVYSVNGKQLANFKAESQVQNQFDASGLPAGVYILTVDDQSQKKSTKFVIEN